MCGPVASKYSPAGSVPGPGGSARGAMRTATVAGPPPGSRTLPTDVKKTGQRRATTPPLHHHEARDAPIVGTALPPPPRNMSAMVQRPSPSAARRRNAAEKNARAFSPYVQRKRAGRGRRGQKCAGGGNGGDNEAFLSYQPETRRMPEGTRRLALPAGHLRDQRDDATLVIPQCCHHAATICATKEMAAWWVGQGCIISLA